jgi:tetratricopeptide (TPR) repeat protein
MQKNSGIILREFTGIHTGPTEENSYEANLQECLTAKAGASAGADMVAVGHAARGAAECYRRLGRLSEAANEYQSAAQSFRMAGNPRGLAWTLYTYSNLLRQQSDFMAAFNALSESQILAASCNDPYLAAYIIAGVAETNRIVGNYPIAEQQHLKAFGVFRQMEDHADALIKYRAAAQVFSRSQDARGFAYALNGIGSVLSETGCSEDAGICFTHAVNYFKNTGLGFGQSQSSARLARLVGRRQLNSRLVQEIMAAGTDGSLPMPSMVNEESSQLPECRELVQAGWGLLNQYRRRGIRYKREEKAKVWEGAEHADCSSFVQHALIAAGYDFARSGRLTTNRMQRDVHWRACFQEVADRECKPGDIILQDGKHMGIFTGFRNQNPAGFQMGVTSKASELDWGVNGEQIRFFRLKRRNGS